MSLNTSAAWPGLINQCEAAEQHSQPSSLSSQTTESLHTTWIPPLCLCSTMACSTSGARTQTSPASPLQKPSPLSTLWTPACLLPTSSLHSPPLRQLKPDIPRASNPRPAPCLDVAGSQAERPGSAANRGRAPAKRRN